VKGKSTIDFMMHSELRFVRGDATGR
jgi:hypothetical protein